MKKGGKSLPFFIHLTYVNKSIRRHFGPVKHRQKSIQGLFIFYPIGYQAQIRKEF